MQFIYVHDLVELAIRVVGSRRYRLGMRWIRQLPSHHFNMNY